jgi:hypothetical protein
MMNRKIAVALSANKSNISCQPAALAWEEAWSKFLALVRLCKGKFAKDLSD